MVKNIEFIIVIACDGFNNLNDVFFTPAATTKDIIRLEKNDYAYLQDRKK